MPDDVIRPGEPRPAGFWIRALALLIDALLYGLVQVSYGFFAARFWGMRPEDAWTLTPILWLVTILFSATYTTVLHSALGQTLGKNLVGIRVLGVDGRRLTMGAALLRWIGYWLSLLPFPPFALGYIMAGLRRDKRSLHDLIAGSRVERIPRGVVDSRRTS